jgi:hypothetical protein
MPPDLHLDADVCGYRFVGALKRAGFDVVLGTLELPEGASDHEQLVRAVELGRLLVTANEIDFARIHAEWATAGQRHFGIVICRQLPRRSPEAVAAAVAGLFEALSAEQVANTVRWA